MLRESFLVHGFCALLFTSALVGCGGTVEHISADDDASGGRVHGDGGSTSTGGGTGGISTGGQSSGGSGGTQSAGGTGYVDPGCPDVEPPPPIVECDPLDPFVECPVGYGCYPYVAHPYGSGCGYQQFGATCEIAGSGVAGDFCGDEHDACAPGFLCVVGAGAGKRCQQLCSVTGVSGCAPGLLCGETDIEGYGVCF